MCIHSSTFGLGNHYTYFIRTIPGIEDQLEPLENASRNKLILEWLEEHQCNNEERKLLALPPNSDGLGTINTADIAKTEYTNTKKLTETHTKVLPSQQNLYVENQSSVKNIKAVIQIEKENQLTAVYNNIKSNTKDQRN